MTLNGLSELFAPLTVRVDPSPGRPIEDHPFSSSPSGNNENCWECCRPRDRHADPETEEK